MGERGASRVPTRGPAAAREAAARAERHTQVMLIRHGEPDWAPADGPSVNDPELTPFGVAQAEATARALAGVHFDALYVSPYTRSQQTAAPLAEVTGLTPVTIDDLAEIGVAVEGLTQDAVDEYFTEAARRPLEEHWDGWPGAETFHDFHERVTRAITEILAGHDCHPHSQQDLTAWTVPEERPSIAIVAHGGTNSVIATHLLDVRPVPWEWLRFGMALATWTTLQARPVGPSGNVWGLQQFNHADHLASLGLH